VRSMLTSNQLEMIEERKTKGKTLPVERKKYIDFTLRNYIKKHLDSLADIPKVLDALPRSQTKKVITASHIIGILDLLKMISLDLAPIEYDLQGNPYAVYRFKMVIKLKEPINGKDNIITIMKYSFPATPEEVELAKELEPYMPILGCLSKNEYERDSAYTMEEWNKIGVPRLHEIISRRGQEFKLDMMEEGVLIGAERIPTTSG
jgi:hypothetical protein